MDHSATRGTRDISDDMSVEEYATYTKYMEEKSRKLNESMTPDQKELATRLGVLFDTIIENKCVH
jgi:hypothetical protein